MSDEKPYRVVATLTQREADAFKRLAVCREACRELVKAVVAEYEKALIAQDEAWKLLAKRHGIRPSDWGDLEIDQSTRELRQLSLHERDECVRRRMREQLALLMGE